MQEKPSRTTFRERLENMTQTLRDEIITGSMQSGSYLPSIQQLSKQYNLSINSVQKGLEQLAVESLIERIPRVGIRVKDAGVPSPVTITFGYYSQLLYEIDLDQLIAKFHELHPNIRVRMIPLQFGNYLAVTKDYLRNDILDVLTVNHHNISDFRRETADLTETFEPMEVDDALYSFVTTPFREQQRLIAKPVTFSPVILCYNKQHFVENEVPEPSSDWTWGEFMSCLDKLEKVKDIKLPFYFFPSASNRWPIFLLQSGANFEGKPHWASAPIMDSIQTCYDLIHRQKTFSILLSENDFAVEKLFAQQKVSVMMTSYFSLNKLQNVSFPFDIAPLPYTNIPSTLLVTVGLALNRRSKHKEAARKLINFLTSYDAQLHIRKNTYSIPALRQAAEWEGEEIGYRPSRFNTYREIVSTYGQLSDLNLQADQIERLLSTINMYWMGINNKEETVAALSAL